MRQRVEHKKGSNIFVPKNKNVPIALPIYWCQHQKSHPNLSEMWKDYKIKALREGIYAA